MNIPIIVISVNTKNTDLFSCAITWEKFILWLFHQLHTITNLGLSDLQFSVLLKTKTQSWMSVEILFSIQNFTGKNKQKDITWYITFISQHASSAT